MKQRLAEAYDWLKQIYKEFTSEHASLTAGAIALFGFLSIFPLLLLAIAGASYALGDPQTAVARIEQVVAGLLVGDASATLTDTIAGVVNTRGIAGFIGLLGFLWAASRVFAIIMQAFNMAWDVEEDRGFIRRNLLAIGSVLLAFLFGIVAFVAPLAIGLLLRYSQVAAGYLGAPLDLSGAWSILTNLIAYAATIGLFFIFYKLLPNRHVRWQSALVGAIAAGTVWGVVKYLFQLYLVNFASYNEVYGALAGVVVLILWLYYSAMILLLGTITAAVYSERVYGDRGEERRQEERARRRAA